eukprot:Opistho-1_new@99615
MASAAVLNPAAVMRRLSSTLASEGNFLPRANYVNRVQRGEVREAMRDDVVEWLLKLNEQFEYSPETFFLAANYLDRFLSTVKVQPKHLQLIAVCCFLIAAKVHEESDIAPTLQELVDCANWSFSAADIKRMERIVLTKLEWQVTPVTAYSFLRQYRDALAADGILDRPASVSPPLGATIAADGESEDDSDADDAARVFALGGVRPNPRVRSYSTCEDPIDDAFFRRVTRSLAVCTCFYELLHFRPSQVALAVLVHELNGGDEAQAAAARALVNTASSESDAARLRECLGAVEYALADLEPAM